MAWHCGDRVTVRGAAWRVVRSTTFRDCEALALTGDRAGASRTFLTPFDRPRALPSPRSVVVSRRRWAHEVSAIVLSSFPYGGLQFCPSSIRLLPYQLEPALAILRHGILRVLVADDVGLGKTVEAGIVIREVAQADHLSRILIVCPAALRTQWARELAVLFDLRVIDADGRWLLTVTRELPPEVNPWSLPGIYLASIDFVKRPEALRPLEDVRWDLLVVDEAHGATPGSARRAGVHALALRSRRLILLTATPHSGDDQQFRALCSIGARPGSPPLGLFSRSRRDTPLVTPPPRSILMPVRLSEGERRLHRLLDAYAARLWRASRDTDQPGAGLVATVLLKRALSGPASLGASAARRLQLLQPDAPPAPAQILLPWQDDDVAQGEGDDEPGAMLGASGFADTGEERATLQAIVSASAAALEVEGKVRVLLRLLRRAGEPAIVFSEYRDTAARLCEVLSAAGHQVCLLHGGLSPDQRQGALSAFAAGRSHLVATDAASEGLNLHHGCRLIVHFELPWTPARLHQRAGRVDRIGQTRRVHEIALVARDTCEQLVLVPLLVRTSRSGAFARAPLMQPLTESRVAAHVLGGDGLHRAPSAGLPPDTIALHLGDEARAEVGRIETLRRLGVAAAARGGTRGRRRGTAAAARSGARRSRGGTIPIVQIRRAGVHVPPGMHAVLSIWLRDGPGALIAHDVILLSLGSVRIRRCRRAAALRKGVSDALGHMRPELSRMIEHLVTSRIASVQPLQAAVARGLRQRTEAMQHQQSTAAQLVQAGLFDRRAMRARMAHVEAGEILIEDERARLGASPAGPVVQGTFELRAILIGGVV